MENSKIKLSDLFKQKFASKMHLHTSNPITDALPVTEVKSTEYISYDNSNIVWSSVTASNSLEVYDSGTTNDYKFTLDSSGIFTLDLNYLTYKSWEEIYQNSKLDSKFPYKMVEGPLWS